MEKISVYQVRDIESINSIEDARDNYKVHGLATVLNESNKAVELISIDPLFVHKDSNGRNYASLPHQQVIHGKWMAKSQMKFLGTAGNIKVYAVPLFVEF